MFTNQLIQAVITKMRIENFDPSKDQNQEISRILGATVMPNACARTAEIILSAKPQIIDSNNAQLIWQRQIEQPFAALFSHGDYLVLRIDSLTLGLASIIPENVPKNPAMHGEWTRTDSPTIAGIWIKPSCRKIGLGSKLLKSSIELATNMSATVPPQIVSPTPGLKRLLSALPAETKSKVQIID